MFSFALASLAYWIFCLLWFSLIQKPIFGIYDRVCAQNTIKLSDILKVYRYGNVSDRIIASYLTTIPMIIGMIGTMTCGVGSQIAITSYNAILALAMGLLAVSDAALYRFWKFKIDSSVFQYLKTPKGAIASVTSVYLIVALICWIIVAATFFFGAEFAWRSAINIAPLPTEILPWWGHIVVPLSFLVIAAVLFTIIRGLGIRPNNPSVVYFSSDPFLNHWALNPAYNLIYSFTVKDEFKGKFQSMSQEECDEIIQDLFPQSSAPSKKILKNSRPNILLVIWESLSAEYSEFFSGNQSVTPNLDSLAREGVAFTNCTSSSFRTDRGLVAILSGYLAQPTTSIIRYTRKLSNLPGLARTLAKNGYKTMAVHGGDLAIMHKNDYYLASGHEKLMAQKDMPDGLPTCKWGIQDYDVMQLVCDKIEEFRKEDDKPFFITLQTLSSHEPFDVPEEIIPKDKVKNSFAYTDKSLGKLVDRLKESGAWDDLLLVVVADHCLNVLGAVTDRKAVTHIPMLFAGGAVAESCQFDTRISQTDLAATLLGQLGIDHSEYLFSRDVLADTYTTPFGYHAFHNGVMLTDKDGMTSVDTMLNEVVEGEDNPQRRKQIDAILQKLYQDLADR